MERIKKWFTDLSVVKVTRREKRSNGSIWSAETEHHRTERKAGGCGGLRLKSLTDESAGEDFIVGGTELPPQIISGDAACSGGFLPVIHLSVREKNSLLETWVIFLLIMAEQPAFIGHMVGSQEETIITQVFFLIKSKSWRTYHERHELRRSRFCFAHSSHHHRGFSQLKADALLKITLSPDKRSWGTLLIGFILG